MCVPHVLSGHASFRITDPGTMSEGVSIQRRYIPVPYLLGQISQICMVPHATLTVL